MTSSSVIMAVATSIILHPILKCNALFCFNLQPPGFAINILLS